MKLATLKRILYVFCGAAYTMLGLLLVFGLVVLPIVTPVVNGHRDNHVPQLALILMLLAIVFLVPGILLFIVAIAHAPLLSSPERSKYLFGATAFAMTVELSADLLNKVLGGSTLIGETVGFSATPWSKEHTLYVGPLFCFGLLALIAVVHDVVVCHKRANKSLLATASPPGS